MIGIDFDTLNSPPTERVEMWRALNRRYFGDLQVQNLAAGAMDARMTAYQVGRLKMFQIAAPAHRVTRSRELGALPIDDYFKLVLQLEGHGRIEQDRRGFELTPGDWSLYDPRVSYSITNEAPARLLVVQIPRELLGATRVPALHTCDADDAQAAGLFAVFGAFLKSLSEQLPGLPDAAGTPVSETVLGLLASTLQIAARPQASRAHSPEVLKQRVRQYVATHLADPGLTIDRIAADLRCSKRYLHRVFEDEAMSLERHIWQTRLERCHESLARLPDARRSVSDIAFSWGFGSSAHFSRLFAARYGESPRDVRRRTLASASR